MATVIDFARWRLYRETIETCLREGYTPPNIYGGKGSAIEEAQRRLLAAGAVKLGPKTSGFLAKWLMTQSSRKRRGLQNESPDWTIYTTPRAPAAAAKRSVARIVILSAAQNDCEVHRPFLRNLEAYAAHLGAEIYIAPFTYNVTMSRERARDEERRLQRERRHNWAAEVQQYLAKGPVDFGPLIFFADMNILPTAKTPLADLDTHSRGKWAVFPHAKVAAKTVAAASDPPILFTTGAVTVPDYTDTKAGIKAVFHHVIGATIVEIDQHGLPFVRQINATPDGAFQDLDAVVRSERVTTGQRVEGITFGDIQSPYLDPAVALGTWGWDVELWQPADYDGVLVDALRPAFGFFHDLLDNKPISHHELRRPIERYRTFVKGHASIERHVQDGARFLRAAGRDWMKSVAIESNHDKWIDRWLDSADHRKDRINAAAFLRWDLARHEAVERQEDDFSIWRYALREALPGHLDGVTFVNEGGSYVICHDAGGIECGAHGHLGSNGAPGRPTDLARVSGKANFGDKHAFMIVDGAYFAGTSSLLDLGYNKGPSSWRQGHIVTYANGKRTLLPMHGAKWRA
jgi:hypothetical protein